MSLHTAVAGVSCAFDTPRGTQLFNEARYLEAVEWYAASEADIRQRPPRAQAEYALYRGLSNLRFGNYYEARRWLGFARQLETWSPGLLAPDQEHLLAAGQHEVDAQVGRPAGSVTRKTVPRPSLLDTASAPPQ